MPTKNEIQGRTRVYAKNQMTIPQKIVDALDLEEGVALEVLTTEGGDAFTVRPTHRDTLENADPETAKAIAQGLADIKAGRVHGPFSSGEEVAEYVESRRK